MNKRKPPRCSHKKYDPDCRNCKAFGKWLLTVLKNKRLAPAGEKEER